MKTLAAIFGLTIALIYTSCTKSKTNNDDQQVNAYWNQTNQNLDYFNKVKFDKNNTLMMAHESETGMEAARVFYCNYLTGLLDFEITIHKFFGDSDNRVKYWGFKPSPNDSFQIIVKNNRYESN